MASKAHTGTDATDDLRIPYYICCQRLFGKQQLPVCNSHPQMQPPSATTAATQAPCLFPSPAATTAASCLVLLPSTESSNCCINTQQLPRCLPSPQHLLMAAMQPTSELAPNGPISRSAKLTLCSSQFDDDMQRYCCSKQILYTLAAAVAASGSQSAALTCAAPGHLYAPSAAAAGDASNWEGG